MPSKWSGGREARHRSAKPSTPVRIWSRPPFWKGCYRFSVTAFFLPLLLNHCILYQSIHQMKNLILLFALFLGFANNSFAQATAKFNPAKYTKFIGATKPVDLNSGEKLVCIFNLECDDCQATAKMLNEQKKLNKSIPAVYVLFYKEGETTPEKFAQITGANFPYQIIGDNDFFNLIGNYPPRVYYLQNGVIKGTWDDDFENRVKANFGLKK